MVARVWIKDPIALLADGGERGLVVEDGRIVELVGRGQIAGRARSRSSTPRATW